MFTLKTDHSYDWPVRVKVPQDGGTFKTHVFTARFQILPQEEIDRILRIGPVDSGDDDFGDSDGEQLDMSLLERVLVGWGEDVKDEDGNAIPFDDESRRALLGVPYVRLAVSRAFFGSISGDAARRKN